MGFRSSFVLLCLIAVAVGLYLLTVEEEGGGGGGPTTERSVWPPGFNLTKVNRIGFINLNQGIYEEMRFQRDDGPWNMVFPRRDRADSVRIAQVMSVLHGSKYQLVGEVEKLTVDLLRQAGLRDSKGNQAGRARIRLRTEKAEVVVWIGHPAVNQEMLFVQIGGRVYRANIGLWSSFNHRLDEYRSNRIFDLDLRGVGGIRVERSFTGDGKPSQVLEFARLQKNNWQLREGDTESRADLQSVRGLLSSLTNLQVDSFVGELPPDLGVDLLDPPFFRVTLTTLQNKKEVLSLGRSTDEGTLCMTAGRPFLLAISANSHDSLWRYLRGRGIKYMYLDSSVDYRFRRPLSLLTHEVKGCRVFQGKKLCYEITRGRGGKTFSFVKPLQRLLRKGAAEAFIERLIKLEAVSTYEARVKPVAETGLDKPAATIELSCAEQEKPLVLELGDYIKSGFYLRVSDKPDVVFFISGEKRDSLIPGLFALVTRRVHKLNPQLARIVLLEGGGHRRRWNRDNRTGLYLQPDGKEAEAELHDLMDRILDLSASKVISLGADELEQDKEAMVIKIHRHPVDSNSRQPGRLALRLVLVQKQGNVLLSSSLSRPLVYQVPKRLLELVQVLAGK